MNHEQKNVTSSLARIFSPIIFLLIFLIFSPVERAYGATVESIKINSISHRFYQGKEACNYEILRTQNGYKLKLAVLDVIKNKQKLDPEQEEDYQHAVDNKKHFLNADSHNVERKNITAFIESINAASYEEFDIVQLGVTKERLTSFANKKLDNELKSYTTQDIPDLKFYRAFHLNRLTNVNFAHRRLKNYFDSVWWHDDPKIIIQVFIDNGEIIKISSKAKHMFMVPWSIEKNSKTIKTYNIQISQALGKLLHPKCANYNRINVDLPKAIDQIVWWSDVRNPWHIDLGETLDSLKTLGGETSLIKQNFTILGSLIRTKEYTGKDDQWIAKLNHNNWSSNLAVNFSTVIENGKPVFDEFFPERARQYGDRVLKVPWLAKYIMEHPFYLFSVQYRKGVSITEADYVRIIDGFNKQPNSEWVNLNYPYSEEIIHLSVSEEMQGYSDWLIFPDATMAMIGHLGNKVMKWTMADKIKYTTFIEYHGYKGLRVSSSGENIKPW
jgi:hypothetical protein